MYKYIDHKCVIASKWNLNISALAWNAQKMEAEPKV